MPNYKLIYFDVRGLAEPIRWILALNDIPFKDKRVTWDEWTIGNLKHEIGFGQLPILQFENGKELTQSMAIMRYLAKKFDLMPEDDLLAAKCDEICDTFTEARLEFRAFVLEQNEDKKEELKCKLQDVVFPKYYKIFETIVNNTDGPFIAGEKLSWMDLVLGNWFEIWEDLVVSQDFINSFPALKILKEKVFALPGLAEYLEQRCNTWI